MTIASYSMGLATNWIVATNFDQVVANVVVVVEGFSSWVVVNGQVEIVARICYSTQVEIKEVVGF